MAVMYLSEAQSLVTDECARLYEERVAFDEFATRITNIDCSRTDAFGSRSRTTVVRGCTDETPSTEDVREVYRDTVLAVDHYELYGESPKENMRAEFGDEVAEAVFESGQFTPRIRDVLVGRARAMQNQRDELLTPLTRERDVLADYETRLEEVDTELDSLTDRGCPGRSYADIEEQWEYLRRLRQNCEETIADRQHEVHRSTYSGTEHVSRWDLFDYVYRPLSVRHPVLAAALEVVGRIQRREEELLKELADRE
ncbi:MAG: hypothetical protein ABEI98_03460 [Halorhabdus sp.]